MNLDDLMTAQEQLENARKIIYAYGFEDILAVIDNAYDMVDDVIEENTVVDEAYYERMMDPGYIYDLTHEDDWYEPYDDFDEGYADFIAEMEMEEYYG